MNKLFVLFISLFLWCNNLAGSPSLKKSSHVHSNKNSKKEVTEIFQPEKNTKKHIQLKQEQKADKNLSTKEHQETANSKKEHKKTTQLEKNTSIYHLTIDYGTVNFTGKNKKAMLINGFLPAPTLYFKEGEKAIIYVTNKMEVETSVHWHGILLPNFQDGVPYLTTPPIQPGKTHKFQFTLKQSGTYWYHSHTSLQEQRGLYGAIVVEPENKKHQYNHDLVLVLSDWTDENPHEVLRTLKRGSEWYGLKKGSTLSLAQIIKQGALAAQISLWRQRMPGMDISDVYYDAFLINGNRTQSYDFKPGETIRLRIINASASTYFWLNWGGVTPLLISADGVDVEPISVNKILSAIAETYDLLITVPEKKALEIRATAQDGSGFASAIIGKGELLKAPIIAKPDPIQEIKKMADMHGGGDHAGHLSQTHQSQIHHDRQNDSNKNTQQHIDHTTHNPPDNQKEHSSQDHKKQSKHSEHSTDLIHHERKHSDRKTDSQIIAFNNYDNLKATHKTAFLPTNSIKNIHLNLTGNMWRYIWSMNDKTLSEVDKIKIKKGEIVRIHLRNTTMMHHPMHLHGHFFRVLNKQGEYSPLKHTVDVPPMETVIIEFKPDEKGDWIFHCHVLYHMKSGMSRVFSHGNKRDARLKNFPISSALNMDNQWYSWTSMSIMSNKFDLEAVTSNTRNKIMLEWTVSWVDDYYELKDNFEIEASYEYFISDFFRLYGGLDLEKESEMKHSIIRKYPLINHIKTEINTKIGFRYLLPYFFELDISVDNQARGQVALEYELLLFRWMEFFAEWEWTMDFGIINALSEEKVWIQEHEWSAGFNYMLNKNFSFIASYSNHFSWGTGINWKF